MNDTESAIEFNMLLQVMPDWARNLTWLPRRLFFVQPSDDECHVYEAFGHDTAAGDQFIAKSGLPAATVSSRLLALELAVMSAPRRATCSSC